MKLKLDNKHYLNSDDYCYWITSEQKSKKDKPYERRVTGYATTLEDLFKDYIDKKIKSSKTETLENLVKEIETLKNEVSTFLINLRKELTNENN